ncbi:MAG TPA: PAS domain S-box protein [Steroidobacteraceae bacterium]|nr:PAS domain S-box protein [Steroidobacteraceae bacterium]
MFNPSTETTQQSKLRLEAETRLKEGSAPPTRGWPTGVSALDLLHALASAPGSADDALKLLHELQVHQVELDLQNEQMEITQRELAEDLARYQALYELAPLAYLSVGPEGDILEGNVAAAGLFGVTQDQLRGRRLDAFLAPESRWAVIALLKRLRAGSSMETCGVQSSSATSSRPLQLVASLAPGSGTFLAMLVDTTGLRQPDPHV